MKTAISLAFMALLLLCTSSAFTNSILPRSDQVNMLGYPFYQGASTFPPVEWNKTYGGSDDDVARAVLETSDGGYAFAGYTYSYGDGSNDDFWLVKTDSQGDIQWNKTYGGAGNDEAYSVVQTEDGGYALAGRTDSSGAGMYDFWLVKTDSQGDMQWNKTYGGMRSDEAWSVEQTSDNGYVIAGDTESFGAGSLDLWIIGTDSYGKMQWNRTHGGTGFDVASSVQQTIDGGYIVAGYTTSFGAGSFDVWLVKLAENGDEQWARNYGSIESDTAYSVRQTADGGHLVVGSTSSSGAGLDDFFLVKTDALGIQQFNKTYGGTQSDRAFSIIQTKEGGYAIAGITNSFGVGSYDFWLIKADYKGNTQWNATYGGSNYDSAESILQTTDAGYVIAGYTYSHGSGGSDAWLSRLASEDISPPLTVNNYDGLWHNSDFTIELTATDDFSGVAEIYYIVNDGSTKSVSIDGQPTITLESVNNTLVYWSYDNAGHQENPKILTEIKLDKTPPLCSITINHDHQYVNSTLVSLMLSATDVTSGVYQARYSDDGFWDTEAWEAFSSTKPWTLLSDIGNKTVYCQVMDNARLVSGTVSHSVFLDTSPPEVSLIDPGDAESFSTSTVVFNTSAIDSESGITNVELYVDDHFKGNMTLLGEDIYILTVSALSNSNHTWFARAQNGAGSVATSQTRNFTIQRSEGPDYALLFYLIVALAVASILTLTSYVVRRKKRQPQNQ